MTAPARTSAEAVPSKEDQVVPEENLRKAFGLDPGITYLNNGSLGPTPTEVLEVVHDVEHRLERDPVGMQWGQIANEAEAARQRVASFLGCNVAELTITRNTTEAMGAIAEGSHLEAGARVLTTDQEHPGGLAGWEHESRHRGVILEPVPLVDHALSDGEIVAALAERIGSRTRVISVSHVTYGTGRCLPLRAIADLAEARGVLLVVDGAQAAGAIPVNLHALGCHAYAASAHKWLLAPKGTGLLYVRSDARERIQPLLFRDGGGVYTAAAGTRNLAGIVGLGAAVAWIEREGMDRIRSRVGILQSQLRRWAKSHGRRLGLEVITPSSELAAGLITLGLPPQGAAMAVVGRLRREHGVVVRAVTVAGREAIRVSLHLYNVASDLTRLEEGLERILTGDN